MKADKKALISQLKMPEKKQMESKESMEADYSDLDEDLFAEEEEMKDKMEYDKPESTMDFTTASDEEIIAEMKKRGLLEELTEDDSFEEGTEPSQVTGEA